MTDPTQLRKGLEELTGKTFEEFLADASDWAKNAVEIEPNVWGLPDKRDNRDKS